MGLSRNAIEGEGPAVARLDIGDQSFYGISAHGQPITLGTNSISRTHAEADAFQQALNAGVNGGIGQLYVDRALCPSCGVYNGVGTMMRRLGLQELQVSTPGETQIIRP